MTNCPHTARNPRLARMIRAAAILSATEAEACLRDHRRGDGYSGEAVNHFGGTHAVIGHAVARRRIYRQHCGIAD